MQVYYMITRCDHMFAVAKTSTIAFGSSMGIFAAFPYRQVTLTLITLLFFVLLRRFKKAYNAYQDELGDLPKKSQERVHSAIHKHHHNQVWWRLPFWTALFFVLGYFSIKAIWLTISLI